MENPVPNDPSPQTPAEKAEMPKLCRLLYGIFAFSLILQFGNAWSALVGSLAVIAGIILVYIERKKARGSLYENHLHWLVRTFWIGGSIYLPVVTVLGSIVFLGMADHTVINQAISNTDAQVDPQALVQQFVASNMGLFRWTMFGFMAPFGVWWLWRCWYGFKRLQEGKPIPNVMSWF